MAQIKYLSKDSLIFFWQQIKAKLGEKANTTDLDLKQDKLSTEQLQNINNVGNKADKTELANYYKKTETYNQTEIDSKLDAKVDKVIGKCLSTNDLTDELKAQYDAAQPNVIEQIKVNNVEVTPQGKVVSLTVITSEQVDSKIATAIAGIKTFKFQIVESLPLTGEANIIYLVANIPGDESNGYTEYAWIENDWEIIGSTQIDLSGYVQFTDLVAITNQEITEIVSQ